MIYATEHLTCEIADDDQEAAQTLEARGWVKQEAAQEEKPKAKRGRKPAAKKGEEAEAEAPEAEAPEGDEGESESDGE